MVTIRNGQIVDDDKQRGRPPGPAAAAAGGGDDDLLSRVWQSYDVPRVGLVPGWGLLLAIAAASFLAGPVAGLVLAGAIYYFVFYVPQQAAPAPRAPAGRAGNTYNSWGGSSMSQTTAPQNSAGASSATSDKMRRARQSKFATMADL